MTLRACVATIIAMLVVAMAMAAAGFAAGLDEDSPAPLATPTATPSSVTTRTVSDRAFRDELATAIAAFNAVGAGVRVRFAEPGEHPEITVRFGRLKPGVAGMTTVACSTGDMPCKTDGVARVVISNESMSEATLRIVIAHELGHALGLDHSDSDGPCSVMTPSTDHSDACRAALTDSPVRPADARALQRIWGSATTP